MTKTARIFAGSVRGLAVAVAIAISAVAQLASPASASGATPSSHNDAARILAGLPPTPGSVLEPLTRLAAYKQHAQAFQQSWAHLDSVQLSKIRAWRAKEMPAGNPTLLYLFSGPDFLYANTFFPDATTYVLGGLEPVGPIPSVTEASLRGLPQLRGSLNSVMSYSFFRTIEMRSRFGSGPFTGTLPILYIFMARSGKVIEDVSLVSLSPKGEVVPAGAEESDRAISGVRIIFTSGKAGDDQKRTLYYFQTDVSDRGPGVETLMTFANTLGAVDAFVKSASYLMHSDAFSKVREQILTQASTLLQDDSGIPVRFFPEEWNLKPLGRYAGPIGLFANSYQAKLAELHRKHNPPQLPFGIGYRFRPAESSLLLATRKPQ
jgi:hypothetical protein